MSFVFNWTGIHWNQILSILFFVFIAIGLKIYAKNKYIEDREKCEAYSKYFILVAFLFVGLSIAEMVKISDVSLLIIIVVSFFLLGLVFIDGWLTQKIAGGGLAIEANPVGNALFRKFGFKKVRIAIFLLVIGILVYSIIGKDISGILFLCLMWVIVDSNNAFLWYRISREQKLKSSVIINEIGCEDIHEL